MKSAVAILGFLLVASPAAAQRARPGTGEEAMVSPAEVQRMFDSYALMQAQQQLQITDEQFPQFLTRFRGLQDVRRRALQSRARRVAELRRLLNSPTLDEAAVRDQMKGMADDDERAQADARKAYESIDQILDVRQQAKFRVFEEMMERRKLELVARARQARKQQQQQ